MTDVLSLAREMVRVDSRSSVSNIPLLETLQAGLEGWEIERIDYVDPAGLPKGNLVARWPGSGSPIAYAGHLDTVSAAGWVDDPFRAEMRGTRLIGLGAADMKDPVAAFLCAAHRVSPEARPTLVLTSDEETTKQGVREVVVRSRFLGQTPPACFIVCEPTRLGIVRGHRVDVQFIVTAKGCQAHSSTGKGLNANIALIPFLAELRLLHLRLREDTSLHDTQYDPPFCDLNFVIDNHGTVPNTTAGLATCHIKFRYSKSFDPASVIAEIERMADVAGLGIIVRPESPPPELPPGNPLVTALEQIVGGPARVMGLGTEASEYSRLAPSLIFGPGDLDDAHNPGEGIEISQLTAAEDAYVRIAQRLPGLLG